MDLNERNDRVKENLEKTTKRLNVVFVLTPIITILIPVWGLVTGKVQQLGVTAAAWIAIGFACLALVVYFYCQKTLPDKKAYNLVTENVRPRYFLRVLHVTALGYVAVPAMAVTADKLLGLKNMIPAPYHWLGLLPLVLGLLGGSWTSRTYLSKGKGTPIPYEPTSNLITQDGPYRYVRNPMVIGTNLVVLGLAVVLSSYILMVLAIYSIIWGHVYAVKVEEKELEIRFGQAYLDYAARVPRWIPRCKARQPH